MQGLFGKPTVINNVLSFTSVPAIMDDGAAFYKNYGMGRSRGTQPFQLAGNIKQGGLVEKAFGVTLKELIYDFGGGTLSGRPLRAVQVGGPLGAYLPADQLDIPMDYEAFAAVKAMLGHGGLVVFDDTVDMAQQARFAMEFCAIESCGKCTPLPHRLDPRRRGDRPDRRRPGPRQESAAARRSLRNHGGRFALRAGWIDPVPRPECHPPFPRRFRQTQPKGR